MAELTSPLVSGKGISSRFMTVLGPQKMEVINLALVATGDTVVSNMIRPISGTFTVNGLSAAMTLATTVAFGTATAAAQRTATLTNTELTGAAGHSGILTIYGF